MLKSHLFIRMPNVGSQSRTATLLLILVAFVIHFQRSQLFSPSTETAMFHQLQDERGFSRARRPRDQDTRTGAINH